MHRVSIYREIKPRVEVDVSVTLESVPAAVHTELLDPSVIAVEREFERERITTLVLSIYGSLGDGVQRFVDRREHQSLPLGTLIDLYQGTS